MRLGEVKRYEKYKDSGVEWIGEVPEHWKVFKLKNNCFFQEGPGLRNWQFTDEGVKVICVTNITESGINFNNFSKCISEEEYLSTYKHFTVNKGDLLLSSSGASWGKVAEFESDETVILNTSTIRINENSEKNILKSYLKFLLQSEIVRKQLEILMTGSCQPNFGPSHLGKVIVPLPEIEEQKKIASFIDQKTSEIDSLIADKEKLIELLQEKRQAIISEAVTKGLDQNVKMKDSGIEWIGEVPEHWEIKRIKHIAFLKSGESITSELIGEEGKYPVYGGNGLRGYTASFTHNGDYILIGRQGALCGNINYAHGKFWASEHAVVVMPVVKLDTLWLGELLRIMNLNQYSISAAQPGLAVDKIKNLFLPFPSYHEQKAIADYIGKKISDIDFLVQQINAQIIHLVEYRQSLISEAVTGKIMV